MQVSIEIIASEAQIAETIVEAIDASEVGLTVRTSGDAAPRK